MRRACATTSAGTCASWPPTPDSAPPRARLSPPSRAATPRRSPANATVWSPWRGRMGGLAEIVLGIMTAVGGFVEVSELTFAAQAGSRFGYALLWAFALATVGIIVFGEMSGRVAAVARQPVFALMRQRLGATVGLFALAASTVVSLITCAAEVGAMGIILKLLAGGAALAWAAASVVALIVTVWVLP